jgi:hypothetical protein
MFPRLSLLTLALMQIQSVSASISPEITPDYHSRATGQFLAGHNQQLAGFVDGMLPVIKGADRFLFADGAIMLGQNQRAAYSGGLGYRGILNTSAGSSIGGAYIFGEYYHSDFKTTQWLLNPGLEWLGLRYEARLQGYLPLKSRNQVYGNTLASNLPNDVITPSGQPQNLNGATGHRVFDTPVNLIEAYGPGVEIEAGRFFEFGKGVWVRAGAYHFNYQDVSNINGVQANVEGVVNRNISVILQNNYDNQNKNRFSIGLRVSLGGSDAPADTLASRLTAPIIRHQARQSYGQAEPTWQTYRASGPTFDVFGGSSGNPEAWFFSPRGSAPPGSATTLSSCTAENPCLTIDTPTAARIQELGPGANLLFETGNYQIPSGNSNNLNWVNLQDGQSILGRNPGWGSPATPNNRPVIEGGLFWGDASVGLSNGVLSNVNIINDNQFIPGDITGVGFEAVVAAGASGNLDVSQTNVTAEGRVDNGYTLVFGLFSGNELTVRNSEQIARASAEGDFAEAYGIFSGNTATISNNTTLVEANGVSAVAHGIVASQLIVSDSEQTVTANGTADIATAIGLDSFNDATISNMTTTVQANGVTTVSANGLLSGGVVLFQDGNISVEGVSTTGQATIIGVSSVGSATVHRSIIAVSSTGETTALADGIVALEDALVTGGLQNVEASSQSGQSTANGISAENIVARNTRTTAEATLQDGESAQSVGINANLDANVQNSTTTVLARVLSGNGFAQTYAISGENVTATDIIQNSTTFSATGESIAHGVEAFDGTAEITRATQNISATSASGSANSRGIGGDVVNATNITADISALVQNEAGEAFVVGIFGETSVLGVNINQTLSATAANGNAGVYGVQGFNDANVTNLTQNIEVTSITIGLGRGVIVNGSATVNGGSQIISVTAGNDASATGVSAVNDATVSGITQNATSTSGELSTATGVTGDNALVDNADITVTANGAPPGTSATGVLGNAGDVTNSDITAAGNGTNNKCLGTGSSDGSCT